MWHLVYELLMNNEVRRGGRNWIQCFIPYHSVELPVKNSGFELELNIVHIWWILKVEYIEGLVEFWKIIKNLERRKKNCPNIPFLNSVLVTWHTSQFYTAALIKWKSTSKIFNMERFKLLIRSTQKLISQMEEILNG